MLHSVLSRFGILMVCVETFKEKVSLTFLFNYGRLDTLLMFISAKVDSYEKIKERWWHSLMRK